MTKYPIKVIPTFNEHSRNDPTIDLGVTDLILLHRRNSVLYIFFLELKTKKGTLRQSQKDWHEDYLANFAATNTTHDVAYGFLEAREKIIAWINNIST